MALSRNIYFDVTQNSFVESNVYPSIKVIDPLVTYDKPTLNFIFVRSAPGVATEVLSLVGQTLRASIHSANGTELSATSVGAATADAFVTVMDLTTSTLLDTVAGLLAVGSTETTPLVLELRVSDGGNPTRFQQVIPVKRAQQTGTPTAPSAPEVAATVNELQAYAVPKVGQAGDGFTLKSTDGTKTAFVYYGNDGTLHVDPIT